MRQWHWFSVFILAALPLSAQNPRGGFVLPPAPQLPGAITSVGFGSRLLQSIQGVPLGAGRGFRGGFGGYGAGAFTPYLLLPPYYPPPPDPGPAIVTAPAPPVVINQTFVAGGTDNSAPPAPPGPDVTSFTAPPASTDATTPRPSPNPNTSSFSGPPLYLIALKGGAVQTAVAYWYEDGAVHYVSPDHSVHDAPISALDPDLSTRLNGERGIDFHPPE